MFQSLFSAVVLIAFGIGTADAHTFGAAGAGLAQGFAHPLGGLDHVLAMVAVGVWAAQLGGRAIWQVPAAFVVTMALGSLVGFAGLPVPHVELGIAGSLLVVGALVAGAVRMPTAVAGAVVGFFALFHGHAHGTELTAAGSAWLYAAGFLTATVLLHALGAGASLALRAGLQSWAVRLSGGATTAAGIILLAV